MALSSLRIAQHAALDGLVIDGRVLDVGGDPKSSYHKLIGGNHTIVFANINPEYKPDLVFDVQQPWPVEPGTFDAVIMFNLLEHVYRHELALANAYTALKTGGKLIGSVPFMFYVHGSPSDYFRYTRFALERLLEDTGFSSAHIQELGTGAFCVAYQAISGPLTFQPLADAFRALAGGMDRLMAAIKPNNKLSQKYFPLGYHFEAVK